MGDDNEPSYDGDIPKKRTQIPFNRISDALWCGRVQSLCDGSLCSDCHLFSAKDEDMADGTSSKGEVIKDGSIQSVRSILDDEE